MGTSLGTSLRIAITGLVAKVRSSPWGSIAARVTVVACALLVLAWIGRASGATAPAPASGSALEPSAPGPAVTAPALASPAPSPSPSPPDPTRAAEVEEAGAAATPAAPSRASAASRSRATPDDPVYLNEADTEELRRLPGVGAKRADAIVAHRRRVGRFQRVEDLLRVKGIGRATIRKWRPLVRLDARAPVRSDAGVSS